MKLLHLVCWIIWNVQAVWTVTAAMMLLRSGFIVQDILSVCYPQWRTQNSYLNFSHLAKHRVLNLSYRIFTFKNLKHSCPRSVCIKNLPYKDTHVSSALIANPPPPLPLPPHTKGVLFVLRRVSWEKFLWVIPQTLIVGIISTGRCTVSLPYWQRRMYVLSHDWKHCIIAFQLM